jgi:hypothetical protein
MVLPNISGKLLGILRSVDVLAQIAKRGNTTTKKKSARAAEHLTDQLLF